MTIYYKVLRNGRSFHGGDMEWSLPQRGPNGDWIPGMIHTVIGHISICDNGIHLTDNPRQWWATGATCYRVDHSPIIASHGDKCVVRSCRLIAPLTDAELVSLHIYKCGLNAFDGIRATDDPQVVVDDTASLSTKDARVLAVGRSRTTASGRSSVHATDKAKVIAYCYTNVSAYGESEIITYHRSKVSAHGDSTVILHDSSKGLLFDNSTASAQDQSQVSAQSKSKVTLTHKAQAEAYGDSVIDCYETSIVHAHGRCTINAHDYSVVFVHCDFVGKIKLHDRARKIKL